MRGRSRPRRSHHVASACAQRLDVTSTAERRVHFEGGIVARSSLSSRVKWCGVTSHVTGSPSRRAAVTSASERAGREVHEVQRASRQSHELDVAQDHQLFGERRPTHETEPTAERALRSSPRRPRAARPRSAGRDAHRGAVRSSRALRMSAGFCTPVPSSVKSRTPSAAISAIGASSSPRRPWVIAPATAMSRGVVAPRAST